MTAPLRVVLHGGLGNQLFQYFKARVVSANGEPRRIALYRDLLARYTTARDFELETLLHAEALPFVTVRQIDRLSRLRIPKLLYRLTRREWIPALPGFGAVLDGYFQFDRSFAVHDDRAMQQVLEAWRAALGGAGRLPKQARERLMHIRLGDFFESPAATRAYAAQRIAAVPDDCDVVTDQEALLDHVIQAEGRRGSLRVIGSSSWDAWNLLGWMAGYRSVTTNGSTLAFWAAALGGATLISTNQAHERLFARLAIRN
jgi:hypothetical protein